MNTLNSPPYTGNPELDAYLLDRHTPPRSAYISQQMDAILYDGPGMSFGTHFNVGPSLAISSGRGSHRFMGYAEVESTSSGVLKYQYLLSGGTIYDALQFTSPFIRGQIPQVSGTNYIPIDIMLTTDVTKKGTITPTMEIRFVSDSAGSITKLSLSGIYICQEVSL